MKVSFSTNIKVLTNVATSTSRNVITEYPSGVDYKSQWLEFCNIVTLFYCQTLHTSISCSLVFAFKLNRIFHCVSGILIDCLNGYFVFRLCIYNISNANSLWRCLSYYNYFRTIIRLDLKNNRLIVAIR